MIYWCCDIYLVLAYLVHIYWHGARLRWLATLAEHPADAGLCLDGGVPEWSMPAEQVQEAIAFAQEYA